MMNNQRLCVSLFCTVLLLAFLCCRFSSAAAQEAVGGDETNDSRLSHFESAFSAASEKYKVALVFEGEPFVRVLSAKAQQDLKEALARSTSPQLHIEALADAFDYQVSWIADDVCAFTKRYSAEDDLPFVPIAEAEVRLRRLATLCAAYMAPPSIKTLPSFIASLSEEQKSEAASKRGVPVFSLSASQKIRLQQFVFGITATSRLQPLTQLEKRFRLVRTNRVLFHPKVQKVGGRNRRWANFPAYTGQFGPNGEQREVILSHWI